MEMMTTMKTENYKNKLEGGKMNILKAEIQEEGKRIQIETDNKGAYKYIWLDSENLIDIAEYSEYLD